MSANRLFLVAQWNFAQLLWSPRTLAMGVLAATPVLIALVYRGAVLFEIAPKGTGFAVFAVITATVSFPLVAPMLSLFYASGVTSDDVEAGTMRYLLTRPIARPELLAGKMLGMLTMVLFLFLPPFVAGYYLTVAPSGWQEVGTRFPSLLWDIVAGILGLFAYNGLFSLAGTVLKRPLLFGLFFVGWQAGATVVPGTARYLTITHYLSSLSPHESLQGTLARLMGQPSSNTEAILALLVIGFATHALAIWVFARKEF